MPQEAPKEDATAKEEPRSKEDIPPKQELRSEEDNIKKSKKQNNEQKAKTESGEDVNVGDLGFFEDEKEREAQTAEKKPEAPPASVSYGEAGPTQAPESMLTRLDKSLSKLEKVIDGAALMRVRIHIC